MHACWPERMLSEGCTVETEQRDTLKMAEASTTTTTEFYYPPKDGEWETIAPEDAGFDADR